MVSLYLAIAAMSFLLSATAAPREIPSYIPICKRSSRDFDGCVLSATEKLRGRLSRGIPELRVPPLEPLRVPMVRLEQGTKAVNYNCTLEHLDVFGLSNYEVISETADVVDKMEVKGRLRLPLLRLEADYDITGRVLLVPLLGKGRFHSNLTNTVADVTLFGHLVEKNGVKYYQTKEVTVKMNVENATVDFENLFNGDKTLGPTTNKFLNENANDLIIEIRPAMELVTAHVVQEISNKVFSSFSYDQLFPE